MSFCIDADIYIENGAGSNPSTKGDSKKTA